MKSIYVPLFIAALIILASCKGKEERAGNEKINTAVTIAPYAWLVKEIGGNEVDVVTLVPQSAACETYEPTPSDIAKASKASLYFAVGANYAFEKNLLKGIGENYKNMKIINCSDGIEIKESNPHIWLYPAGLKTIAETICESLSKSKPERREYFTLNKDKFIARIDSVDQIISAELKDLKGKKMLVFHPSWLYFAQYYSLEQIAIENEGKEPTAQDLKNVVDTAKRNKIKTLFLEPHTQEESAAAVKEELKADIQMLNPMEENILNNLIAAAKKISGSLR